MRHTDGPWTKYINSSRYRSNKERTLLLLTVSFLCFSAPSLAQENASGDRVDHLEKQLQNVLEVVDSLKQELQVLKSQEDGSETVQPATAQAPVTEPAPSRFEQQLEELQTSVARTTQRLADVEEITLDVDERVGSRSLVRVFDAESLDLGGFLHTAFTLVDGENNTEAAVNRLTAELLFKAEIDEKWSLFFAQAFIRESDLMFTDPTNRLEPNFNITTKTPLVIATATYRADDAFVVDAGRFITPHGIVNIEHFPALLLDPEQPQFLRPFGGQTVFANFMNGLKVSGNVFRPFDSNGQFGYAAYVGSFVNNSDSFNYGGRAFWTFGDSGLTAGANVGGGRRKGSDSDYVLFGGDFLYDKGPIIWKNEIFVTDEDLGDDRLAFYSQPGVRFADGWTGFYRFDFLDDGAPEGDKIEHAFGVTFRPNPHVHLRAIARLNEFEAVPGFPDADAQNVQLSATLSF